MRLENYTNEELLIQIRNFDYEIEKLKNDKDLFEKQLNINNKNKIFKQKQKELKND